MLKYGVAWNQLDYLLFPVVDHAIIFATGQLTHQYSGTAAVTFVICPIRILWARTQGMWQVRSILEDIVRKLARSMGMSFVLLINGPWAT